MVLESFEIVRVLLTTALTFILGLLLTLTWIRLLITFKMGKSIRAAADAPVFASLHAKKSGTPTMGGVVIWGSVLLVILGLAVLGWIFPELFGRWSFLTRSQTWLPLGAFIASALVGLVDDFFNVRGVGGKGGGLRMRHRIVLYTAIALIGALWFAVKLGWDFLHLPFLGDIFIGWWYVPFFVLVIVSTSFSVNETDGLDGLAGGTLMTAFGAYAVIAFSQGRFDLAVFCGAIAGALCAFLWHNIHPAKFFMGDTGAMALGVTLGIVAMLTNTAFLLPIIGFVFVVESLSVILQVTSKKLRAGQKIFQSSPIHHHFEAIGWPESQIVMRAWVISLICAAVGVSFVLLDGLL